MTNLDLADLWASDETRHVDLGQGFWVEIKVELDHGEEQAMQGAAMKGMTRQQIQSAVDETEQQDIILMDAARLHFLKLAFYLVDWNFKDAQGRSITLPSRVEDRVKILKRLRPKWGMLISTEIDKLREEQAANDPNALAPAQTTGTLPTPSSSVTATLVHTEATMPGDGTLNDPMS